MLVLTVNIYQHLAQSAQLLQGHRLTIDVSLGFAIGVNHPSKNAFAGGVFQLQVMLTQPFIGSFDFTDIKAGADIGTLSAIAHPLAIRAISQGLPQGIQHNRFSGSGLTGYYRHSRLKVEIQVIYQGEVLDVEMSKHDGLAR